MNDKKTNTDKQAEKKALVEARDWFAGTTDSPITIENQEEFDDWIAESPTHKEKFDLVKAVWDCSDSLMDNPQAIEILREDAEKNPTYKKRKWIDKLTGGLPIMKYAAVAATIALIVGGFWYVQRDVTVNEIHYTSTGEQKETFLSDGSKVHLDTRTMITASITGESRRIELIEGRASFSVVRDTNRPFIVNVGRVSIRALGTL